MSQRNAMLDRERLEESLAEYDRAIAIYAPLVENEGRRELAHELAGALMNRGNVLRDLGRPTEAMDGYDKAIAILKRLVEKEGRAELADDLRVAVTNKSAAQRVLAEASDQASDLAGMDETALSIGPVTDAGLGKSRRLLEFESRMVTARRRLGEFDVLGYAARGGMCNLLRGWQPMLERSVALKVLQNEARPEERDRFFREIRLLGRVRHSSLVQIYASGSEQDRQWYAMEWIEGATMSRLCSRLGSLATPDLRDWQQALSEACGALPPANLDAMAGRSCFPRIAEWMQQISGAADVLHQAGVVHRNITPSNIMVTANGVRAVLIDLGLAIEGVTEGARVAEGGFVGTPAYASPEQVAGDGQRIDGRSDVYSLGVVLWELLTLRRMHQFSTLGEFLERVRHADPEAIHKYNPRVPADLEAICWKCLHKDRERRYSSAQGLADDLRRFLSGDAVAARPRSTLKKLLGWITRHGESQQDLTPVPAQAPHSVQSTSQQNPQALESERVTTHVSASDFESPRARSLGLLRRPHSTVLADQPAAGTVFTAPDQAFSSQTVVTQYPAPIAIAFRRFVNEEHPRSRLEALFYVLEASIRYLVTLGASDLFHCLVESRGDSAKVLSHVDFNFLRWKTDMQLGRWVGVLRETARCLAAKEQVHRIVEELPEVCRPGGPFDAGLLETLVRQRNKCVHRDGSICLTTEECRSVLSEYRPCLEEALREMRFICRYPLGFLSPFVGMPAAAGQRYYHLHSCMGAWFGSTTRAVDLKTTTELRLDIPFVANPDGCRLLYLWPLLLEKRSEYTSSTVRDLDPS